MADEEILDAREPPPIDDFKEGWERDVRKHIFILSSSGKPIYSRYGDEQDIVTTFGLLQAGLFGESLKKRIASFLTR